jgi:hypothetical protein
MLRGEPTITLDTDWFYRMAGKKEIAKFLVEIGLFIFL